MKTIKNWNRIAYGVGDIYGGGAFFLVGTFMMFYLINVVHLSPVLAGLAVGIGKAWDAIFDPLMGYISDRTTSRFGRRRVFFLLGIIPVAVTFALIWFPLPVTAQMFNFLFYTVAFILFYTAFTVVMVPYSAIATDMTTDYRERNRLSGMRLFFSQGATLLAAVTAQPIINAFADQATGHFVMGLTFGLLFALPWLAVFLGTWELPFNAQDRPEPGHIISNFFSIFRNRSFRVHLAMYICAYASIDILMAGIKFFIVDILNQPQLVSPLLGTLLVSQMIFLPMHIWHANTKSIARAFMTGLSICCLALVILAWLPINAPKPALFAVTALLGAGLSAAVAIPWVILPFVVDVDELMTGKKRAGTYSGAMTLVRKLTQGAIVLPLFGFALDLVGYQATPPGQEATIDNATSTLLGLKLLFLGLPVGFLLLGIIVATRFRLTRQRHACVVAENERLHAGGDPEDVSSDTQEVFAMLTGYSYQKLRSKTSRREASNSSNEPSSDESVR